MVSVFDNDDGGVRSAALDDVKGAV